jgi:hypothetical protein
MLLGGTAGILLSIVTEYHFWMWQWWIWIVPINLLIVWGVDELYERKS